MGKKNPPSVFTWSVVQKKMWVERRKVWAKPTPQSEFRQTIMSEKLVRSGSQEATYTARSPTFYSFKA